ncbi:type IV secretion system protein [Erythrobacter sp. F6033]|uniref:type IV secretion system protein n=1 Tax=Erythrobacter sp. F6033 TaxID=2926401 RepID=UPI001FF3CFFF|nr:type IV secretion system protein [Erythrobacter sp. F6033]MCK0127545.1 type IV secretion system protein [Erythrobacter sp. F6033]
MTCPAIITGDRFLERVLTHIDCQAQIIGSYGYQALGEPGSPASVLVTGLLTIFIALFGIRMMFGPPPGARDVVYSVIKIGLVLTLAFSWPAFRTVVYDVTLDGPAEIVGAVQASSQSAASGTMVERLQGVDNDIVTLITVGTGRNTGQFLNETAPEATFAGTALQDDAAFGYSRLLFLAGVIAPLALLRIGAAILLALTPIAAGLLFFTQSRGIFAGWARGLVFTIGGSIAITLGLTVQLAIVEPWLADALRVREFGYATPSAPLELFATMFAFMLIHFALLWLLARVTFYRGWPTIPDSNPRSGDTSASDFANQRPFAMHRPQSSNDLALAGNGGRRAESISNSVEHTIRRERSQIPGAAPDTSASRTSGGAAATYSSDTVSAPRLGSSYRRRGTRPLRSKTMRDNSQ